MKIFVATQNKGKIEEIKLILSKMFSDQIEILLPELKQNIPENGKNYYENALLKALWWKERISGIPILCEDSGLEIFVLGGYPGKDSAVVPRPDSTDYERCMHILDMMENKTRRTARYVSCALIFFKDVWFYDFGYTYGEITYTLRGTGGFGYDPIFFSPELNKTFGESSIDEKTEVSHRKRAIEKLKNVIQKIWQGSL
ncbi:MAG: non-canonical purine NTP pyrophosphatase [Candidatus Calescibacterium sp.]|nr:non-canonical purine NTP pyrophosphatase [Candidatus Calescibacterium sp.]MCX7733406.1 non-canonical purine NTP pyrophosphatase [bacterium]MDW8087962.1 non-canonical purine NTP pyrophosphatase [Candidatus Calescibacterium sp.]